MSKTTDIIENYFSGYAAAVAQSRALVSVEDGLKPSLRMALYANYTDKWCYPKKTGKFIKLIGSASRFCWHGDASTYGMLIRSAKPFAMRYPLYDTQGSFGTLMDPDSHAAPRYVEGRISALGAQLFNKIDENTILEWRDNYDNTEKYPALLPSVGFWNLCNGTCGIGTGLASSVPQFNLVEMNNALVNMLLHNSEEFPLPDFATGGILLNKSEVKESLANGHGASCRLRARIKYDDKKRLFKVTELPYATYTNTICQELEKLMEEPENGIDSFNDATGAQPDIEIYLAKKADPAKVLELLYAKTSLENTYSINLTMLEDGRYPKIFTLPEAMHAFLNHQMTIYHRSYEYQLEKALERSHILEGYILACANIDEVIEIIKNSPNKASAADNLVANFSLDLVQANAILKLTLAKITSMEVEKFQEEFNDLLIFINDIQEILDNESILKEKVASGLKDIAALYGDERRTELLDIHNGATKMYYFDRTGKVFLNPPKGIEVVATIIRGTPFFCVTNKGAVYKTEIEPKRGRQIFKLDEGEYVINVFPYYEDEFLLFMDKDKHFRCKENSTLNKNKTALSLTDIVFADVSTAKMSKAEYIASKREEKKN